MPDITMCMNKECEKRYECYRYMVEPSSVMQSYSKFENTCTPSYPGMFWQIRDYDADNIVSVSEMKIREQKYS